MIDTAGGDSASAVLQADTLKHVSSSAAKERMVNSYARRVAAI
jgi:hypothetical protein